MRITKLTFDLAKLITVAAAVLLIVGVLPFTPAVVGALVIGAMMELSFTWKF